MPDVIHEMSAKRLGMTCVVDAGRPAGRHRHRRRPAPPHDAGTSNLLEQRAARRHDPAAGDHRPAASLPSRRSELMEERKITSVVVVDADVTRRGRGAPARPLAHADDLSRRCCWHVPRELTARASRLRLLLLDVDGVLTDGAVIIDDRRRRSEGVLRSATARRIVWAQREGLDVGLLSGRPSGATTRRAAELGIELVSQAGPDKRQAFARTLCTTDGLTDDEVAYMGDDLLDLPCSRGSACRRRRPTRPRKCARACTGSAATPGAAARCGNWSSSCCGRAAAGTRCVEKHAEK